MTKLYETINRTQKIKELYNELYSDHIYQAFENGMDAPIIEEDFSIEIMDLINWFHYEKFEPEQHTTNVKLNKRQKSFDGHIQKLKDLGIDVADFKYDDGLEGELLNTSVEQDFKLPEVDTLFQQEKQRKDKFLSDLVEAGLELYKAKEIASYLISLKVVN